MSPPSSPSLEGVPEGCCGFPLVAGAVPGGGADEGANGVDGRVAPGVPAGCEVFCPCRVWVVDVDLGSSDWSGPTSWSMAAKTELTLSPTSDSCGGSLPRSLLQLSRCACEKEFSAAMGPSEPSFA